MCFLFLPACLHRDDPDSICFVLNAACQEFFTPMFALKVTAPICLLGKSFSEEEKPANPFLPGAKQALELVPSSHQMFTKGSQL